MWIALTDGYFSIVEHRDDSAKLLVRARLRDNLERVWSTEMLSEGVGVEETPDRDYRFRTTLSKRVVAERMRREILGIDYDNFKNTVRSRKLGSMYNDMWGVGFDHQEKGP